MALLQRISGRVIYADYVYDDDEKRDDFALI